MQVDEASDCWKVKGREGGRKGHCACFLTFSQLFFLFHVQYIGCIYPTIPPQTLRAQSFHLPQKRIISFVFEASFIRFCSLVELWPGTVKLDPLAIY